MPARPRTNVPKAVQATSDPTTVYGFVLFASGLDTGAADFGRRFIEAGCDDATIWVDDGFIVAEFDREAETLTAAISSAIEAFIAAGALIEAVYVGDGDRAIGPQTFERVVKTNWAESISVSDEMISAGTDAFIRSGVSPHFSSADELLVQDIYRAMEWARVNGEHYRSASRGDRTRAMGPAPAAGADCLKAACDRFNAAHAVGDTIRVWPGPIAGEPVPVRVRHPAQVLGGHTPVVSVTGGHGCIALSHVQSGGR